MTDHRRIVHYFLSYAHADAADVKRFREVMEPVLGNDAEFDFRLWSDRQIQPGELWKAEIEQALADCSFGLLLVSPQFLGSRFIVRTELPPLLEKVMVVPVGLHKVLFDGSMDLKGLGERQLFLDSKKRTFDACGRMTGRRDFALELFSRIRGPLLAGRTLASAAKAEPAPPKTQVAEEMPQVPHCSRGGLDGGLDSRKRQLLAGETHQVETEQWIAELEQPSTTHQRRAEIGQRLAEAGDPRPGVGVINGIPDILWREIPGGEVEVEQQGRFHVEAFRMAAYPVTGAQFRAFVEAADGYSEARWWQDLERQTVDPDALKVLPNHPVTKVSWNDAVAFCRWASERVGYEVRLPHEVEWQWAAQSAEADFTYPWGARWQEGVANTGEAKIKRTTAVGMYRAGESRQRVADLAGNVWQWCRNNYHETREEVNVRGGSWLDDKEYARARYPAGVPIRRRTSEIGFRLVR